MPGRPRHAVRWFIGLLLGLACLLGAVLPATSHTAVITQIDLLAALIEPFLAGETPKGFFDPSEPRRGEP